MMTSSMLVDLITFEAGITAGAPATVFLRNDAESRAAGIRQGG